MKARSQGFNSKGISLVLAGVRDNRKGKRGGFTHAQRKNENAVNNWLKKIIIETSAVVIPKSIYY